MIASIFVFVFISTHFLSLLSTLEVYKYKRTSKSIALLGTYSEEEHSARILFFGVTITIVILTHGEEERS